MAEVAELVAAAAGGDRGAWDDLVERFNPLVWAVARGHRLDTAEAADVVQTSWLRLVEHIGRLREPERVGAWLATTARRESLHAIKRAGRALPTDDEIVLEAGADPDRDDPAPEAAVLTAERDRLLWRALATLSERCQRLLRVLMADPPPAYEDVAAALEMPIGSIGPTRGRCLERLRVAVEASGITGGAPRSVQ